MGSNEAESREGARSALGLAFDGLMGTLLGAGFSVLLARSMSTADFGQFSAARGMLGLSTIVATLGFGGLVINAVPRYLVQQELAPARGLLHFAPRAVLVAGASICALILAVHKLVEHDTAVQMVQLAALMVLLPFAALQSYLESVASAMGGALKAATVTRIVIPGTAILLLGLTQPLLGDDVSVVQAAGIWGGGVLIGCVASYRVARRWSSEPLRAGPRTADRRALVRAALPYVGTTAFLVWLDIGGLIVIGWVVADAAAAGRFAAAAQLSSFMVVIGVITLPLYLPHLSVAIQLDDHEQVRRIERRRNAVIVPLTLLAGGLMCAFHGPLLALYGSAYGSADWALVALVIGKGVSTILALSVPQMQYRGESRRAVMILGTYAVLSVGVMIHLSRYRHATGVAIGQATILALAMITMEVALRRARAVKRAAA